ncbi:MAG: hypothetical protein OEU92_30885 [Alphaproteobacteria bacterium]|nr:hypothetical protein [Alphaproteobacteria bacterium]
MSRAAIGNRSGGELALWVIALLFGLLLFSQFLYAVNDVIRASDAVASACRDIGASQ